MAKLRDRPGSAAALAGLLGLALFLCVRQAREHEASPAAATPLAPAEWHEPRDDLKLVERIRAKIVATQGALAEAGMTDYQAQIRRGGATIDMVAIPGGEFLMGSPADEQGRLEDEGPQRKVRVGAFWMGKYELTWQQFDVFVSEKTGHRKVADDQPLSDVDAVSGPTEIGFDRSLGMKTEQGYPAVNMTQHCASKFCQWLSAQTGHYYRLPTEAEWEYACRAGTSTRYHFGDDSALLGDYAIFDPDQVRVAYDKVGTKKPNPWGLHDMHGNVAELCLDQYFSDTYRGGRNTIPATQLYPRVMRGGSWYDPAELLRSSARGHTETNFKAGDAKRPRSMWLFTHAPWLGFRVVRPLQIPDAGTMFELWNSGGIVERQPAPKSAR